MELDPVVAVAIGILATVFVISVVVVIVICKYKYCRRKDLLSQAEQETRPNVTLVENMEGGTDVELDDVKLGHCNLNEIIKDEAWVNDITGLIPHCLAILKTCHQLTEKLVAMTMKSGGQLRTPETHTDIIATAKRIPPRVDAVVTCMYPPLDPRLLEARCTALVLSVSHLVLTTKHALRLPDVLDWIDQSLADVEEHLQVLREASVTMERYPEPLEPPSHPPGPPPTQAPPAAEGPRPSTEPSHVTGPFDEARKSTARSRPNVVPEDEAYV